MWTPLSAGHWICLLTLAAVMLSTGLEVREFVGEPCCYEAGPYTSETIIRCIQQTPTKQCRSSNYAVKVKSGKWHCIRPDSKWIKQQIRMGKVICNPGL